MKRVAVVGGGVAGLSCARRLVDQGWHAEVFDEGRGPGGRASTRRVEIAGSTVTFDHGAQYFTARDASFRQLVSSWVGAGVVQPWNGRIGTLQDCQVQLHADGPERFVGTPGMSALVRELGKGLHVRHSVRVSSLKVESGHWSVLTDDGNTIADFDEVVLAIPAPQARALATVSADLSRKLAAVEMPPCWAAMVAFEERLSLEIDAAFVRQSPLAWIARDSSKPGRVPGERWVLHACPGWSELNSGSDDGDVVRQLLEALCQATGVRLPEPIFAQSHFWRFARVREGDTRDCLHDAPLGIGACGDWCFGGRIEGACLSGRALAERLLEVARSPGGASAPQVEP